MSSLPKSPVKLSPSPSRPRSRPNSRSRVPGPSVPSGSQGPATQQGAGKAKGRGARPSPPAPGLASKESFRRVAESLKLLGDPTRLEILAILERGPVYVARIVDTLSRPGETKSRGKRREPGESRAYSQPAVSYQLKALLVGGLVARTREGKRTDYRLTAIGRKMLGVVRRAV